MANTGSGSDCGSIRWHGFDGAPDDPALCQLRSNSILWDRNECQLGVVTSKVFDGELDCAALEWPEDLRIHVGAGLDIFPGEKLVCAGRNTAEVKTSHLVSSGRLVEIHARPPVAIWNQDDLRAADRQFFSVEHQPVNLCVRMAELKFERAQRLAARNREARLEGLLPVDARALQVNAARDPEEVYIERTFRNVAERESAVGLYRGKAKFENGEILPRAQIDMQVGQVDLRAAMDAPRQTDPRRQNQGDAINVRVAHVERLPGRVSP